MNKMNRILAMLLIAVFAFSQLPMAALAAEGASGHAAMTSDTHDTGADCGGSEPDMGAVALALGMTMLGEEGEGAGEGGESVGVATWDEFKVAISGPNIGVITITDNLDALTDSAPITINRTIRITSVGEYTVDMKGASIEVVSGGSLTLDGALVLQGAGDQVIKVQEGGVTAIGGNAKISSASETGTGVYVKGGTLTIKDDVEIEAIAEGVGVYGGTVNIEGGTITGGIGVYVEGGETTINGGTIEATYDYSTGVDVYGCTVTIDGEAKVSATGESSTGISVLAGGTVSISGEAEITATDPYSNGISVLAGGTVNVGGKAKILVTGERSDGISVLAGGTVNIGGEAEVSATGATSKGINVRAGDKRSKGVSVLEGGGVNISGGTITGTEAGVGVFDNSTVTISGGTIMASGSGMTSFGVFVGGGEVTISGGTIMAADSAESLGVVVVGGTVTISGGTITATGSSEENCGVYVAGGTAAISGGTITATGSSEGSFGVYVEDGEITISGGTIMAAGAESLGVFVEGGTATISGGTITATGAENCGVFVEGGTATISGGTITATGAESFGFVVRGGDVNFISSAGLVINGGIYYFDRGDTEPVFFELLQSLPAPISVSAGQRTAEFTLAAGAGVTFEIDNDNTSVELAVEAVEIDADNKVTLTLPGAVGMYELVLSVSVGETPTPIKLTIPVTVKPRSTSMPTIPAAGGAAQVSYTASGGTLFLQMPAAKVNEIIEKSGDSTAEFDLSRAGSATAARLPGDALSSYAQAGLNVTLRLPTGTMTLSSEAAASVATQATDENVYIELQQAAAGTLTDAQKAAVGSGDLVLDINIYSGTHKISNFDGTLAMAVPYDGPLPVAVWYLNDAGELERLDGTFENGMVRFTLHHLSIYVVGQDTEWKNPFADVKESSWYYDAVAFIAQKGITAGTTAATFSPDATLTRGQFITMLLRAYEIAPDDGAADNFADAGDTYYTGYLAAARRLDIGNGVGDNKFAPEQAITRQEMFTLLYNALVMLDDLPAGDSGRMLSDFADSDAIADWARAALAALVERGIVSGSGGRLEPTATTTRGQMAQVIYNLLGK